ncbi:hypothetical protein [Sphingomonas sp. PAMC 26617]|uniref:hypothetical protein n=1 Tax=Sphingomonas sp. PAMC 26617 TaxID=1112216 RepID=UPI0012F4D9A6|nr:hypothetical protein [Sphingomonas sp. PAMC 26617]
MTNKERATAQNAKGTGTATVPAPMYETPTSVTASSNRSAPTVQSAFAGGEYDNGPGHYAVDTSAEAAAAIAPVAMQLRAVVHKVLCLHPDGLTVDETCAIAGYARYSLQPRFTELLRKSVIRDTGARRRNVSGRRAIVWRATVLDRMEGEA